MFPLLLFCAVRPVYPGGGAVRTDARRGRVHVRHHLFLRVRPQSCPRRRCNFYSNFTLRIRFPAVQNFVNILFYSLILSLSWFWAPAECYRGFDPGSVMWRCQLLIPRLSQSCRRYTVKYRLLSSLCVCKCCCSEGKEELCTERLLKGTTQERACMRVCVLSGRCHIQCS